MWNDCNRYFISVQVDVTASLSVWNISVMEERMTIRNVRWDLCDFNDDKSSLIPDRSQNSLPNQLPTHLQTEFKCSIGHKSEKN